MSEEAVKRIVDGTSWSEFCDAIKMAGSIILSDSSPDDPLTRAEGFRFLSRVTRTALEGFGKSLLATDEVVIEATGNCSKYRRDRLCYASHLTDSEWALIEPLLPPASPLGRPRETVFKLVMEASKSWRRLQGQKLLPKVVSGVSSMTESKSRAIKNPPLDSPHQPKSSSPVTFSMQPALVRTCTESARSAGNVLWLSWSTPPSLWERSPST